MNNDILFDNYTQSSSLSIDYVHEFEQESEIKLKDLLNFVENNLYKKKHENDHKENNNVILQEFCDDWKSSFDHLRICGIQIFDQKEQYFFPFSDIQNNEEVNPSKRECPQGGYEEEVIEIDNEYLEIFGKDSGDDKEEVQKSRVRSNLGFPPVTPNHCIEEYILHTIVQNIWLNISPLILPLVDFVDEDDAKHKPLKVRFNESKQSESNKYKKKIEKKFQKNIKNPELGLITQNIEYGLDNSIRIYGVRKTDLTQGIIKTRIKKRKKRKNKKRNLKSRQKIFRPKSVHNYKKRIGTSSDRRSQLPEIRKPLKVYSIKSPLAFPTISNPGLLTHSNNIKIKFPTIQQRETDPHKYERDEEFELNRAKTALPKHYVLNADSFLKRKKTVKKHVINRIDFVNSTAIGQTVEEVE